MAFYIRSVSILLAFAALAAAQCNLTFQPTAGNPSANGGDYTFTVLASTSNCDRTPATNNSDWVTVSFGQSGGGLSSSVGYTVKPNLSPTPRTGSITVSAVSNGVTTSANFSITQAGAACTYGFSPSSASVPAKNVVGFTVAVNTKCSWTVTSPVDWLTVSMNGPFLGNASFAVNVADNPGTTFRRAALLVNDQMIQIQQSGVTCAFGVTPPSPLKIDSPGGSASFTITTDPACSWTASSAASWISVPAGTNSGPGAVAVTVAANSAPQSRTATLTVAGQQISISQAGVGILFTAAAIQNAASFAGGALSPGEIFVLYGTGLGPSALQTLLTTPDGKSITTSLGNTRVLFDGVPSPMIYSSSTQVSAIVPFAVQPGAAHVTVEYLGVPSTPITMNVLAATPGIFTISQTGTGQGAVQNQDYSINGPGNAETAGRYLTVYWTGGGVLNPVPADGKLVTSPLPVVTFPMSATIGGVSASIAYSGAVPTLVPGILQTNILIPANAPKGDAIPLLLQVGDSYSTQAGITVAIR